MPLPSTRKSNCFIAEAIQQDKAQFVQSCSWRTRATKAG